MQYIVQSSANNRVLDETYSGRTSVQIKTKMSNWAQMLREKYIGLAIEPGSTNTPLHAGCGATQAISAKKALRCLTKQIAMPNCVLENIGSIM